MILRIKVCFLDTEHAENQETNLLFKIRIQVYCVQHDLIELYGCMLLFIPGPSLTDTMHIACK